jgi:hypothetical protein
VKQTDDGMEIGSGTESMIIASLDARNRVEMGDRLTLTLDTLRIHLFDMETGDAIGRTVE